MYTGCLLTKETNFKLWYKLSMLPLFFFREHHNESKNLTTLPANRRKKINFIYLIMEDLKKGVQEILLP